MANTASTQLLDNYDGPFNPDITLADFSRAFLTRLTHEYNLIGHLYDRVSQPLVAIDYGVEGFTKSGIEEWQAASPIYSKRVQKAMHFEGDTVETIFKNVQLEVGAPQQFLDFQFRLDSPDYGEFWLAHCGALVDLETNGNDKTFVKAMCHDIEDPTFDATAAATNPRIVMRPIHRPPRINEPDGNGENRFPHCRWKVFLSDGVSDYQHHPHLAMLEKTHLANTEVVVSDEVVQPGGLEDYSGAFDPHLVFADFSQRALQIIAQENAIMAHLLSCSFALSILETYGQQVASDFARRAWLGHACVAADRLVKRLGIKGEGGELIAKVLQLHPHFQPKSYINTRVELQANGEVMFSVFDCPALHESNDLFWFTKLSEETPAGLVALAQHVNPQAVIEPNKPVSGARYSWAIRIDQSATPVKEPFEMQIARASRGVDFVFEDRRLPGIIARG